MVAQMRDRKFPKAVREGWGQGRGARGALGKSLWIRRSLNRPSWTFLWFCGLSLTEHFSHAAGRNFLSRENCMVFVFNFTYLPRL